MKRPKTALRLCAAALLAALLCLLPGCGAKAGMEFTFVLPRDVLTLDPQAASWDSERLILGEIFEGLCRIDEDGEAVPGVASRWSAADNDTRFTFHLRRAYWSDGEPVTAEDFLFGIRRALRAETHGQNIQDLFVIKNARAVYNGSLPEDALGVTASGDRTLEVELSEPCPDFPLYTAGVHYMPCREDFFTQCAGHYGLTAEYLYTNGPFTFPSDYAWSTDYNERSVTLCAASTYRGERKALPATVTYVIDYEEAWDIDPFTPLRTGDVDLWPASPALRQANEDADLLTAPNAVTGLLLNSEDEVLSSAVFRQLLFGAIRREDLLARGKDLGEEAVGVIPAAILWEGAPCYAPEERCYPDPIADCAPLLSELLSAKDWDRLPSITVLCPDDPASIDVANGLLVSWNETLGTAFNILPMSREELNYRVRSGDYQAALYDLTPGGPTAFHVLAAFSGTASPKLMNSPAFDAQLQSSGCSREALRALEQALKEEEVFYPLFATQTAYLVSPKSRGIALMPDGLVEFSAAKKRR